MDQLRVGLGHLTCAAPQQCGQRWDPRRCQACDGNQASCDSPACPRGTARIFKLCGLAPCQCGVPGRPVTLQELLRASDPLPELPSHLQIVDTLFAEVELDEGGAPQTRSMAWLCERAGLSDVDEQDLVIKWWRQIHAGRMRARAERREELERKARRGRGGG